MGLFKRNNRDEPSSEFLEDVDLPSSNDLNLNGDVFAGDDAPLNLNRNKTTLAQRTAAVRPTTGYGIEDAIKLMRSLPRDNNEIVVTVVKKTLESTQIQVSDIVSDADSKEERIREHHKILETEIKELQEQIAQRNQQITELLKDLKETTDVRQRLQLAMDLDKKNTVENKAPSQEKPATPAPANAEASSANPAHVNETSANHAQAHANPNAAMDPMHANNLRRRPGHRGMNPQN